MSENARRYVLAWAGAAISDEAVEKIADHVSKLWDMIGDAEASMNWWAEEAIALGWTKPSKPSPDAIRVAANDKGTDA